MFSAWQENKCSRQKMKTVTKIQNSSPFFGMKDESLLKSRTIHPLTVILSEAKDLYGLERNFFVAEGDSSGCALRMTEGYLRDDEEILRATPSE